jgi:hypothetical protein
MSCNKSDYFTTQQFFHGSPHSPTV